MNRTAGLLAALALVAAPAAAQEPPKQGRVWHGTLGGQAVRVLATAVQAAGSSRDYDKIAAALRGPTLTTLLGDIKFDENGQAVQNLYLVRVQNGDITTVRQ